MIRTAETWECELPLAQPIVLGRRVITSRNYQVLRLELVSGRVGTAIGYTRGLPLTELLRTTVEAYRKAAPDPLDPQNARLAFEDAYAQTARTLHRAAALVDLALWDAAAGELGLPVHRMLGDARDRPEVMAVCGYYAATRPVEDVIAELARHAEAGIRRVKLIAPSTASDELIPWLAELIGARLPLTLAVDLYNSFANVSTALPLLEQLDALGLDFIEDPFRAGDAQSYAAVASRIGTPLAAGEDAVTVREWADLLDHGVRILRADVTVTGGFSGFLDGAPQLSAGASIVPHVFPAVHANLAATGTVGTVEVIDRAAGTEPIHLLGVAGPVVHEGRAVLNDAAGLALGLDWAAVEQYAVAKARW